MNWHPARRATAIVCLVLGAFALAFRLYYIFSAEPAALLRADAAQYFRIAINVVDHGVYSDAVRGDATPPPESYRGPGYPTLIAIPWALSQDVKTTYWAMLILQAALGAGVAVLVFLLSRHWMAEKFALAAGLLVSIWPHLVVQTGCLLTESVFGFLLVAALYLTFRALVSKKAGYGVVAALAYACAALINSMIVLFPLLVFALILCVRGWRHGVLFLVLALTPPLLWEVRDVRIEAPGVKTAGGRLFENVLVGLEPDYKPIYRDSKDPKAQEARERMAEISALYNRDKVAAYRSILTRISEHPTQYLAWFLRKPVLLWQWDVAQGAGDIYIYPMVSSPFESHPLYRIVDFLCFAINLPLMIAAFCSAALLLLALVRRGVRGQNQAYLLCCGIFLYAVILYTVLNPDARYANPFRPFEIALACGFIANIAQHLRKERADLKAVEAKIETDATEASRSL